MKRMDFPFQIFYSHPPTFPLRAFLLEFIRPITTLESLTPYSSINSHIVKMNGLTIESMKSTPIQKAIRNVLLMALFFPSFLSIINEILLVLYQNFLQGHVQQWLHPQVLFQALL